MVDDEGTMYIGAGDRDVPSGFSRQFLAEQTRLLAVEEEPSSSKLTVIG